MQKVDPQRLEEEKVEKVRTDHPSPSTRPTQPSQSPTTPQNTSTNNNNNNNTPRNKTPTHQLLRGTSRELRDRDAEFISSAFGEEKPSYYTPSVPSFSPFPTTPTSGMTPDTRTPRTSDSLSRALRAQVEQNKEELRNMLRAELMGEIEREKEKLREREKMLEMREDRLFEKEDILDDKLQKMEDIQSNIDSLSLELGKREKKLLEVESNIPASPSSAASDNSAQKAPLQTQQLMNPIAQQLPNTNGAYTQQTYTQVPKFGQNPYPQTGNPQVFTAPPTTAPYLAPPQFTSPTIPVTLPVASTTVLPQTIQPPVEYRAVPGMYQTPPPTSKMYWDPRTETLVAPVATKPYTPLMTEGVLKSAIGTLSEFNADTGTTHELQKWIRDVDNQAHLYKWSDEWFMYMYSIKLKGQTGKAIMDGAFQFDRPNPLYVRNALITRLEAPTARMQLISRFNNLRQLPDQPIHVFITEFDEMYTALHPQQPVNIKHEAEMLVPKLLNRLTAQKLLMGLAKNKFYKWQDVVDCVELNDNIDTITTTLAPNTNPTNPTTTTTTTKTTTSAPPKVLLTEGARPEESAAEAELRIMKAKLSASYDKLNKIRAQNEKLKEDRNKLSNRDNRDRDRYRRDRGRDRDRRDRDYDRDRFYDNKTDANGNPVCNKCEDPSHLYKDCPKRRQPQATTTTTTTEQQQQPRHKTTLITQTTDQGELWIPGELEPGMFTTQPQQQFYSQPEITLVMVDGEVRVECGEDSYSDGAVCSKVCDDVCDWAGWFQEDEGWWHVPTAMERWKSDPSNWIRTVHDTWSLVLPPPSPFDPHSTRAYRRKQKKLQATATETSTADVDKSDVCAHKQSHKRKHGRRYSQKGTATLCAWCASRARHSRIHHRTAQCAHKNWRDPYFNVVLTKNSKLKRPSYFVSQIHHTVYHAKRAIYDKRARKATEIIASHQVRMHISVNTDLVMEDLFTSQISWDVFDESLEEEGDDEPPDVCNNTPTQYQPHQLFVIYDGEEHTAERVMQPVTTIVVVQETVVKAIVDTGSSITAISRKLYKELCENGKAENLKPFGSMPPQAANGSSLVVDGIVRVCVKIGAKEVMCNAVVVPDLPVEFLLGVDFLWRTNAIISFAHGSLQFANPKTSVPVYTTTRAATNVIVEGGHVLRIPFTMTLPARSEWVIYTNHAAPFTDGDAMVEPLPLQQLGDIPISVAYALTVYTPKRQTYVKLFNASRTQVTLYKDQPIGTIRPLANDDTRAKTLSVFAQGPETPPSTTNKQVKTTLEVQHPKLTEPLVFDISESNLTEQQLAQLSTFLHGNYEVFCKALAAPGSNDAKLRIDTGDHPPIATRERRRTFHEREEIRRQVRGMLEAKLIRPSTSPWAAPVVLAMKKDGTWHFCIDYRKLNAVTKRDVYPLPRIDDTLDALGKAKYFSTLDFTSGYYQLGVEEVDTAKTAFITADGLFEWIGMPMGLTNAPARFQRTMDLLLSGLTYKSCLVYLDDIIVFSSTFEQHLYDLQVIFQRLKDAHFYLKPSKCRFAVQRTEFLGHIVSSNGVQCCDTKIAKVKEARVPTNVKEVRSFLGLASFYRRFIFDFTEKAYPLYSLILGDKMGPWTSKAQESFDALKKALTEAPILAYPDFSLPFIVACDASDVGLGAVLSQVQGGVERVIAYASWTLKNAETKYTVTERECLAIIRSVKYFRPYLHGAKFTIVTDHSALKWLFGQKDPTGRIARWILTIQEYDFTVVHKPGRLHANADALSRPPIVHLIHTNELEGLVGGRGVRDTNTVDIIQLQENDPQTRRWLDYLREGILPDDPKLAKCIVAEADRLDITKDGILVHIWWPTDKKVRQDTRVQVVVPLSLRPQILMSCHDDPLQGAHLGFDKTFQKIRERYWWPHMYSEVTKWIDSCHLCASRKSPKVRPAGKLQPISVRWPGQIVGMDLIGPLPLTKEGKRYILVITDHFTKWAEAIALRDATGEMIAKSFVKHWLCVYGAPEYLLSDRGKNFIEGVMKHVVTILGVHKINTSAWHPQTDGMTERFNGTLVNMLAMCVNTHQKDWDSYISFVLYAFRCSRQDSTKESPYFLTFGRDPVLPIEFGVGNTSIPNIPPQSYALKLRSRMREAFVLARANMEQAQHKQKQQYDRTHSIPVTYKPGDLVWLYTKPRAVKPLTKKFLRPWKGPFTISEQTSPVNYRLYSFESAKAKKLLYQIVHVSRLKPYVARGAPIDDAELDPFDNFDPTMEPAIVADDLEEEEVKASGENAQLSTQPETTASDTNLQVSDEKSEIATDTGDSEHSNITLEPTNTITSPTKLTASPTTAVSDDVCVKLTQILARRDENGEVEYLVEWDNNTSTWEFESKLHMYATEIHQFLRDKFLAQTKTSSTIAPAPAPTDPHIISTPWVWNKC